MSAQGTPSLGLEPEERRASRLSCRRPHLGLGRPVPTAPSSRLLPTAAAAATSPAVRCKCTGQPQQPCKATSTQASCCLTLRSRRRPPAGHWGRDAPLPIMLVAAPAPCRRPRLSSNVRPQMNACLRRLGRNPKNNAVPARPGRAVRSRKTRRAAIEVTLRLVRDSGKSTAATSPGLFSQTEALCH